MQYNNIATLTYVSCPAAVYTGYLWSWQLISGLPRACLRMVDGKLTKKGIPVKLMCRTVEAVHIMYPFYIRNEKSITLPLRKAQTLAR